MVRSQTIRWFKPTAEIDCIIDCILVLLPLTAMSIMNANAYECQSKQLPEQTTARAHNCLSTGPVDSNPNLRVQSANAILACCCQLRGMCSLPALRPIGLQIGFIDDAPDQIGGSPDQTRSGKAICSTSSDPTSGRPAQACLVSIRSCLEPGLCGLDRVRTVHARSTVRALSTAHAISAGRNNTLVRLIRHVRVPIHPLIA